VLDRRGGSQAQFQLSAPISAAAAADDGSAFAACTKAGGLSWFRADLTLAWEKSLDHSALGLALDPFGRYAAISDRTGNLRVMDCRGEAVWQAQAIKPFIHLTFIPEAAILIGAAEFGLVAGHDFSGRSLWRDTPVAHIGSLTVTADGQRACLACYSDGLRMYARDGKALEGKPQQPSRLAAYSADGRRLLVADTATSLHLLDGAGDTVMTQAFEQPALALALDALGHSAVIAFPDRSIVCMDLDRP
jgi:hypothetical protein